MTKWTEKLRKLKLRRGEDPMAKAMNYGASSYVGPTTTADIVTESWNQFFREGGSLNQPIWLQGNKLKSIRDGFTDMARWHKK